MTRATLLHVLDRPTALGPAEVRELEQLAQAFPYCQTAHLLLAKAAHDQGTMLAGQRLRRAATYAADRALLRRLIEQVEPTAAEALVSLAAENLAVPVVLAATPPAEAERPVATATAVPAGSLTMEAPAAVLQIPATEPVVTASVVAPIAEPALAATAVVALELPLPEVDAALPSAAEPAEAALVPTPADAPAEPVEAAIEAPVAAPEAAAEQLPAEAGLPLFVDQEGAQIPVAVSAIEAEAEVETLTEVAAVTAPEPGLETDLPPQAPAIRPPVEVGEARFEFGLAEPALPVVPTYELPGLIDEWAAAAVTLSLGGPALLATPVVAAAAVPVFTPAAFTGDAAVGYAFGESSRLGFSMQLLDLLTARAETAESITAVVAAAQPPATALPPSGTFFEPDPLLLAHWATHCPPPPALPSSLDLINNFLRRQPRLTRPAMLPPAATHQADLSVRSTRAEPDLVSENLARIFVRQGKTARAIEIYEKLMVKQPEKMAYFASQIQQLQPPA